MGLALTDRSIPKSFQKAFIDAVFTYRGWLKVSGPEPTVVWYGDDGKRNCHEIKTIADFCMNFADDMMPDRLYEILLELSAPVNNGEFALASKSYADGARCLHALVRHELKRQMKQPKSE